MSELQIPLARSADRLLGRLASTTGSSSIAALDGQTLLGERAALTGLRIPSRRSAGGGCILFDALDDSLALNLSRPDDLDLLPALFEVTAAATNDERWIAAQIASRRAPALLERGRTLGLAIAATHERQAAPAQPCVEMTSGPHRAAHPQRAWRVVDLSALWAGPLASHLLWLAGAEVIKVESRHRPDGMRLGDQEFFSLLNQGKDSVAIDFKDAADRAALINLIRTADIVIEAARPRALAQLGIDADELVRTQPGLVWLTITGHGATGTAADWIGFGDDCGVAAGLSAALLATTGEPGFVGDAIADPLSGLFAACAAWEALAEGRGARLGIAMSGVVRQCLSEMREHAPDELHQQLRAWHAAIGQPFPVVRRRSIGSVAGFGEHTHTRMAQC